MIVYFFLASSSAAFYERKRAGLYQRQVSTAGSDGTYDIGPLLSLTSVPLVGSGLSQCHESVELLLLGGDSSRLLGDVGSGDGDLLTSGGGGQLLGLMRLKQFSTNANTERVAIAPLTEESPFLVLPAFLGKTMSRLWYSCNRATLTFSLSSLRAFLL